MTNRLDEKNKNVKEVLQDYFDFKAVVWSVIDDNLMLCGFTNWLFKRTRTATDKNLIMEEIE